VAACGVDARTAEVFERRLTPDHAELLGWLRSLPGPVAVTYEAGPTGFGLARFLAGEGVACQVAAPSKLQRPPGDRVKTDRRDARYLARLLHLDEIVAVTVPARCRKPRDLVRAREDVRGDLLSVRHRLSKLLLRQGIPARSHPATPPGPGCPATRDRGEWANRRRHPLGKVRRPPQTARGRQHRDRPRTRRMVLVARRPRRLTSSNHRRPGWPGGGGCACEQTRERPMSNHLPPTRCRGTEGGDARC
jgi:hypothetical protein